MPTPALNEKIEEPEFIVKAAEDDGSTVEAHKKIAKASRERKELATLVREPGRSLLPFSRVQKIIRADKVWEAAQVITIKARFQADGPHNRTYQWLPRKLHS